jgi:hypothetical protein
VDMVLLDWTRMGRSYCLAGIVQHKWWRKYLWAQGLLVFPELNLAPVEPHFFSQPFYCAFPIHFEVDSGLDSLTTGERNARDDVLHEYR